ncbi:hypothetical protein ACFWAR_38525 [Streptomyces sp. NPDC059917]|uniref:hypothetical protein n=1 Tax=Streptomyces sp. NPDC059917 TaxID=3347002 RepID=UPI00365BEC26
MTMDHEERRPGRTSGPVPTTQDLAHAAQRPEDRDAAVFPGEATAPPGRTSTPAGRTATPPGGDTAPPGEAETSAGRTATPPGGDTTASPGEAETSPGRDSGGRRETVAGGGEPLLGVTDAERYRTRWTEIQGRFVDEPREAVRSADTLAAEVMQAFAGTLADHRGGLEKQWDRGEEVATEDLRQAMRAYRSLVDRLLAT